MGKMRSGLGLLKSTVAEWWEDQAPRSAAALSFYTLLSLAPLLLVVVALVGLFVGTGEAEQAIEEQVRGLVGEQGGRVISEVLRGADRPAAGVLSAILGFAILLVGATGVFGELQTSLNKMWEVRPKPGQGIKGMLRKRLLSFGAVLAIGFLLLVSLVLSAAITAFGNKLDEWIGLPGWWLQLVNAGLSLVLITVLVAFIYRFLPDAVIRWRDVWVGAFATALLFTIGKFLIGFYLGHSSTSSSYGAFGSLVVFLVWVYYSAQILFLGAELTQVYANRFGASIRPEEHAELIPDRSGVGRSEGSRAGEPPERHSRAA